MADDFGFFSSSESGAPEAAEEDPAAAFLAQQESEIAGIENDEGFGASAGSHAAPAQLGPTSGAGSEDMGTTVNGDMFREANGPADGYAAIAQADRLTQEPESIRKWREEQRKRLQELGEGGAEPGLAGWAVCGVECVGSPRSAWNPACLNVGLGRCGPEAAWQGPGEEQPGWPGLCIPAGKQPLILLWGPRCCV
uniref:Clathrin light chain n=1 Tax=Papio anubis TaxID=9555 RepID=A0A8I5R1P9_PAPAN